MKNSNKLLIALLTITLIVLLGSNLVIKAEFDKINPNDIFYGYSTKPVKPFKVIVLKGNVNGFVDVSAGQKSEIKTNPSFEKFVTQKISGDTLTIHIIYPERGNNMAAAYTGYGPTVHIETPDINEIYINEISCALKGFKSNSLKIHSQSGFTRLENNTITNLEADQKNGSTLEINKNTFGKAVFEIRDSSRFEVGKDVFTSIELNADTTATVSLPGNLLNKFTKK